MHLQALQKRSSCSFCMHVCIRAGHFAGLAQPSNCTLVQHAQRRPAHRTSRGCTMFWSKAAASISGVAYNMLYCHGDGFARLLQAWRACACCGLATTRWRCRSCTVWTCWPASHREPAPAAGRQAPPPRRARNSVSQGAGAAMHLAKSKFPHRVNTGHVRPTLRQGTQVCSA